ncbi:MAG: hypothetical protein CMK83_08670 [Pseudomonadales bacterium]|jgi:hypothetical protein|nr:hypothetical protein [Pseudomonadales bacterium]HAG96686.1 hypothetical protein [Gammaproteobacteria bacterium]HAU12289.1 hypothetical protein [Gammaproteobacteria bacterium]HBO96043.1 hypothetical protein [Gammaproteobacteria bacterium]|tara:strand:- start:1395 stop:2150 length:756 start_codon:yes stop_codon:yes gene_type:complete
MEAEQALKMLNGILSEIEFSAGVSRTDDFGSLRAVDAKVKETKMILSSVPGLPQTFVSDMDSDENFEVNSRRVRLETLSEYIRSAVKFLKAGGVTRPKKQIIAPPDYGKITAIMPGLQEVIDSRWREAQRCQHVQAYTGAIILMGSVLEALLLCRANSSPDKAYQSAKAPKNKMGKVPAIQDWNLNTLIEVAVDCGWLKSDRGKFSHALRESRNVVHPWVHVTTRANFDESTCLTSWEVLKASVRDLMESM